MKIVFSGNTDFSIFNYRFELCQKLIELGHEVLIVCPNGEYVSEMVSKGCVHINVDVNSHGVNFFEDFRLKRRYKKIFKAIKPDFVCGYTIKPNIYGAMACRSSNIRFLANITGLGRIAQKKGILHFIAIFLYKIAFSKVKRVFCQNESIYYFFKKHKIASDRLLTIPGSGVNLSKFNLEEYPNDNVIRFAFVSRIMKEKGIDEYVLAARILKKKYQNLEFHVFGKASKEYDWLFKEESIIFHGASSDVPSIMKSIHCLVFPSYYPEGLANVLLEACATGRPVITTNTPGCKESVLNGFNGLLINPKDSIDLVEKILQFIELPYAKKREMGLNARKIVEEKFDRNRIINVYLSEMELLK